MIKTVIMIFGPAPANLVFKLGETTPAVKSQAKYVGMNFPTDTRNMFEDHYKAKASTARYCVHRMMGIEDSTGRLTPKELKTLYMARWTVISSTAAKYRVTVKMFMSRNYAPFKSTSSGKC
jgi:hypothetical protein